MKYLALSFIVLALTGCAVDPNRSVYDPLANIRNNSFSLVENYSQSVKFFLTNHTEEEALEKAREAVAESLKDPSSAQFRNVRLANYMGGKVICGEVNAKNSYGGYVGFTRFVASTTHSTLPCTKSKYPEANEASDAGLNSACGY